MPRKKKQKTVGALKNDAAKLLQRLRRLEEADEQGYCKCCTCDKIAHYKEMQGGHFIERGRSKTVLDERNINPQCPGCNCWAMKTATGVLRYRKFMVEKYGEETVDELESEAYVVNKWNRIELEDLIAEYKERIKEQEERLGD